uniref:Putative ovule protein n=1 Tax=Solanum chacoense TaxID=4108 RepID=A0A0V0H6G3_SOLCH
MKYQQIILETDSWSLVQILQGTWEKPWSMILEINSIQSLLRVLTVRVVHSLREGNTLADFFD